MYLILLINYIAKIMPIQLKNTAFTRFSALKKNKAITFCFAGSYQE
jgi:hypothetical protein